MAGKTTVKDIKVIIVQDLCYLQIENLINISFNIPNVCGVEDSYSFDLAEEQSNKLYTYFIDWYNKQYKNYDENPYIFLYEIQKVIL